MLDSHSLSYLPIGKSVSEYDLFFCGLAVRGKYTLTLVKHPRILAKMCSSMHASEFLHVFLSVMSLGDHVWTDQQIISQNTQYKSTPNFLRYLCPAKSITLKTLLQTPQASRIGWISREALWTRWKTLS